MAAHDDDGALEGAAFLPFAQEADAVGVGHPDVEQDELGFVLEVFLACFFGVGGGVGEVAFVAEDVGEGIEDAGFVVDDEDFGAGVVVVHGVVLVVVRGRVMVILAPPRSRLWPALMVPSCSCTIFLTMARPRPVPLGLLVT